MHRMISVAATAGLMTTAVAVSATLSAAPASAGTVPYRSWTQTSGNTAGIQFNPSGDRFVVWDNVHHDGHPAAGWVAYRTGTRSCSSPGSAYRFIGEVYNGHRTIARNVREHTEVCFYVTISGRRVVSPVVRFRTS